MTSKQINSLIAQETGRNADYYYDLNAMHESEAKLSFEQSVIYEQLLDEISNKAFINDETSLVYPAWHATAAQRAEAFLRCIGKWEQ